MGAGGKLGQKMDEEKERGKLATPGGGRRCWYRVNLGFDFFFFTKINRFFIWFCLHRLDQLYQFNFFLFLTKSTLFFRYNIFQAQTPFLKTKKI
jgi:hypothetical protein